MGRRVPSIMMFVKQPWDVANWYSQWLNLGAIEQIPGGDSVLLSDGSFEAVFHAADAAKNPWGRSTVIYWASENISADIETLHRAGATLHRGPLTIAPRRTICQMLDPWGNAFGLEGPAEQQPPNKP
ncbi:VOC family protein [Rhodococcus jostii]|uniref:Glyoxalase/fosfomycin resistance/dioxygenase domain-containing protein n=1 Tax=Rhodococcus jostii TaxID=132919 RepID=A0A1H4J6N4_RHOJO|nr:VOC family protein [Rhodococcus jostii]SEB41877.1 hypothetical protein SAMN04490220_0669 [Rhodococcus jostii]